MKTKPDDNHRYEPAGAPNTYFRFGTTSAYNKSNTVIHHKLDDVLEALHKKRLNWEFIGTKYYSSRNECIEFRVYQDNEYLGVFGYDPWNSGGRPYSMDCRLLSHNRQRGSETVTGDPKKAVKTILDNFIPRTTTQLVADAREAVHDKLTEEHATNNHKHRIAWGSVSKQLEEYIVDNWELFSKYTQKHGDKAFAEELTTSRRKRAEVYDLMHNAKGYDIILRGPDYIVSPLSPASDTQKYSIFSEQDLPNYLKVPMTFLKLRDPNTVVPGVGYRNSDTEFYVIGEEEK